MKKSIVFLVIIVIAISIMFFSFFWPLNNKENLQGTIGGVERADKYRGEQPNAEDILLDNEEFTALTQSAEWQNAMKNEEMVKFLKSDEFKSYISLAGDLQKMVILNRHFDVVKNDLMEEPELTEEVVKIMFDNQDFQEALGSNSQDFQQAMIPHFSQEFQKAVFANAENIEALEFTDVMKAVFMTNSDFNQLFSTDFQKFVKSQEFENYIYSDDFQKFFLSNSQDYQNTISPLSQDFQKVGFAPLSQDFQKQIMSQDFQAMLQSNFFESFWLVSQDFQQNMLGAFQNYLNGGPGGPF